MAEPLRRDLIARRNTPFAEVWPFTDRDTAEPVDFTGATVSMQVRLYGAQAGDPLIDLAEVVAEQTEGLLTGTGEIAAWIGQTTLLALPRGADGAAVVFRYDLKVQLAGELAEVWTYGTLTVKPGVTDRLRILTNDAGVWLTNDAGTILIAG